MVNQGICRIVFSSFILTVTAAVLPSACRAEDAPAPFVQANQTAVAQSVAATLTAVATEALDSAQAVTQRPAEAAATPTPAISQPPVRLPAPAPDWRAVANKPNAELGEPDAPVVLVEYSDFQCPWCTRFATQVLPLIKPLIETGDVRYIYKHFPILGDASIITAQAAECAGKQGDFWSLHDWLFANPGA